MTDFTSRDTDPSDLLPPDDAPTSVHPETPFELVLVLRELNALTRKVDALTALVRSSVDTRLVAEEALQRTKEHESRLDAVDARCHRHHHTNGAAHHD